MTGRFMLYLQGFSVEGSENIQEILSKQLYLCQFLVALSILRTGIVTHAPDYVEKLEIHSIH